MASRFPSKTVVLFCIHIYTTMFANFGVNGQEEFIGSANGKDFYAVSPAASWHTAKTRCQESGKQLAELKSGAEVEVISNYSQSEQKMWVGLRDAMDYTQLVWNSTNETPKPHLFAGFDYGFSTPITCGAVFCIETGLRIFMTSSCYSQYKYYCEQLQA